MRRRRSELVDGDPGSLYGDPGSLCAPDPAALAAALILAQNWSHELEASELWNAYVRSQTEGAWTDVFSRTKNLDPEFQLAAKHDPNIAKRFRQTRDFLNARRTAAAKGAATRKRKKTAAKKTP